jgi:hypothetical protein
MTQWVIGMDHAKAEGWIAWQTPCHLGARQMLNHFNTLTPAA